MSPHAVLLIPKKGISAYDPDPNNFIVHSDFNTFKIVDTGLVDFTIPANSFASYTHNHGKEYRPLVMAFMREDSLPEVVFANNRNPNNASCLGFDGVRVDYTQMIFRISNTDLANSHIAHIRYFILEVPL